MGASGKGSSSNRSSSSSSSTTTYNIDNSIRTSDFGAIAGATEIAKEAFDLGRSAIDANTNLSTDVVDAARFINQDSLDFGSEALGVVADLAESGQQSVIKAAGSMFDQAIAGIKSLALQTSATSDDRVQKIAIVAFVAAAAAVVVPKVFGK